MTTDAHSPEPAPQVQTPGAVHGYALSESVSHRQAIATRTVADFADFFTPHLHPGMRLLDCGCGPGSMTLDFAPLLAPGEVIGIDIGPDEVAAARMAAGERGLTNVRFEVGNVYALPFPDASFDAAFTQALLLHLSDPLAALKEIRRVLKPGGVIGVSDGTLGAFLLEPATPLLDLCRSLQIRTLQHHGGDPFYAPRQRQLLLQAGFARTEACGRLVGDGQGTLEQTRAAAAYNVILLRDSISKVALEQGWADQATLDALEADLLRWGEAPDSFAALVLCQAVGWV